MTRFVKMQASGNDYVYIDLTQSDVPFVAPAVDWIVRLCDRHFGVGADGVVYISNENGYHMRMYNADGSRGRICGNALRSIASHLDDQYGVVFPIEIETDAGRVRIDKEMGESTTRYSVALGKARLVGIADKDSTYPFFMVDVGNRHAVCQAHKALLPRIAERARLVGGWEGLNVETWQILGVQSIAMQVIEHGTGRTLACGSGATAVGFTACHMGVCTYGIPIKVQMDGGLVEVVCHKDGAVRLIGEARVVYRGEYAD